MQIKRNVTAVLVFAAARRHPPNRRVRGGRDRHGSSFRRWARRSHGERTARPHDGAGRRTGREYRDHSLGGRKPADQPSASRSAAAQHGGAAPRSCIARTEARAVCTRDRAMANSIRRRDAPIGAGGVHHRVDEQRYCRSTTAPPLNGRSRRCWREAACSSATRGAIALVAAN